MKCPNKNLKEWKDLVAVQGENQAYYLWNKFEERVPLNYYNSQKDLYLQLNSTIDIYDGERVVTNMVQKANTSLNTRLTAYLKKYNITVEEVNNLKELRGVDAIGVTDLLNKIIQIDVKKQTLDTLPEEAAHVFTMLLSHTPEMDWMKENINKWEGYREVYNDYYTTYEGNLDKIAFEAVGKFIALHLIKNEPTVSKEIKEGIFKRLWRFIAELIKDKNDIKQLNDYAKEITQKVFNDELLLNITPAVGTELVDFKKALNNDFLAKQIHERLKGKFTLVGSAALSTQGTIFRKSDNLLHDLDYRSDANQNVEEIMTKEFPNAIPYHNGWNKKDYITKTYIVPPKGIKIRNQTLERGWTTGYELFDKTGKTVGKYETKVVDGKRLAKQEGVKALTVDVFDYKSPQQKKALEFASWDSTFNAKLEFAREKDIVDWVNFLENEYRKTSDFVFYQLTPDRKSVIIDAELSKILREAGITTGQVPTQTSVDNTITYTPKGKAKQTYTIDGNKILNAKGEEVFAKDSADRRKIYANYAVRQGRAVVVEHPIMNARTKKLENVKYVVNNKQQILSTITGNLMKWEDNNPIKIAILQKAEVAFGKLTPVQQPTQTPDVQLTEEVDSVDLVQETDVFNVNDPNKQVIDLSAVINSEGYVGVVTKNMLESNKDKLVFRQNEMGELFQSKVKNISFVEGNIEESNLIDPETLEVFGETDNTNMFIIRMELDNGYMFNTGDRNTLMGLTNLDTQIVITNKANEIKETPFNPQSIQSTDSTISFNYDDELPPFSKVYKSSPRLDVAYQQLLEEQLEGTVMFLSAEEIASRYDNKAMYGYKMYSDKKGFVVPDGVVVNTDLASIGTAIHEQSHVHLALLKIADPSLYEILTTEALKLEQYKAIIDENYSELDEEQKAVEILTTVMGDYYEDRVNETLVGKIKNMLLSFYKGIENFFNRLFDTNISLIKGDIYQTSKPIAQWLETYSNDKKMVEAIKKLRADGKIKEVIDIRVLKLKQDLFDSGYLTKLCEL